MKNQIIFTALTLGAIILGTNSVKAQDVKTPADQSATTVASIELADVISINAGSTAVGGAVNFAYKTVEDYTADQAVDKVGSLNVTSTKEFDITVKANTPTFKGSTDDIDLNVLTIKPVTAAKNPMKGAATDVILSTDDQKVISGAALGSELMLDIQYFIPAAISKSPQILGKPAGTYTTTVTYTATTL